MNIIIQLITLYYNMMWKTKTEIQKKIDKDFPDLTEDQQNKVNDLIAQIG